MKKKLRKIIINIKQIHSRKPAKFHPVRLIPDYPENKIGRHIIPDRERENNVGNLVVWEPPWDRLYAHVSLPGVEYEDYWRAEPLEM